MDTIERREGLSYEFLCCQMSAAYARRDYIVATRWARRLAALYPDVAPDYLMCESWADLLKVCRACAYEHYVTTIRRENRLRSQVRHMATQLMGTRS